MSREVIISHSVRVTVTFELNYPRTVAGDYEHSVQDVLDMVEEDVLRLLEKAWPKSFIQCKLDCELGDGRLPEFDISAVSI